MGPSQTHVVTSLPVVQLTPPKIVPSHSPRLSFTSSSSALYIPTPGVIAFGGASPNVTVGTVQLGHGPLRASLVAESSKGAPLYSRPPQPQARYPGFSYSRGLDPRVLSSDSCYQRPIIHPVPSNVDLPIPGSSIVKPPHPTPSRPRSSGSVPPYLDSFNKVSSLCGTQSQVLASFPGVASTGKPPHGRDPHRQPSSETGHPSSGSSVLFVPSPVSSSYQRLSAHSAGQSPSIPVNRKEADLHDMTGFQSSLRQPYPNVRPESGGGIAISDQTRKGMYFSLNL